jgi:hypothetical protein
VYHARGAGGGARERVEALGGGAREREAGHSARERAEARGAATAPVPADYNDLDKVVERVSSNSSTSTSKAMSEARTRSPGLDEAVAFAGCLDVVRGRLTCCELKHPDGAPCDREELVLPIMGLFYKIYRDRSGDSLVASVYNRTSRARSW